MTKILHIGAEASPEAVSGVNNVIWSVAKIQSSLGYQVMLLVEEAPKQAVISIAEKLGIKLIHIPIRKWDYEEEYLRKLLDDNRPDIVHLHSIFNPKQASLSKKLVKKKIPYVVTPHAMLFPPHLKRNWLKKYIYFLFLEKPRLAQAAAITFMTPREGKLLRDLLPNFSGELRLITNPVDAGTNEKPWKGNLDKKRLVYLGRFDFIAKGIDILIEIACCLPQDIEVHLYGLINEKFTKNLKKFCLKPPANIYFHPPVYGVEKAQVLSEASLYIQTSRSEVFGLSIANAMHLGLPCAVANTLNIADLFREQNLGLVLPSNPQEAADYLTEILQKPDLLWYWSKQGKSYAQENFQPYKVASQYLALYKDVLQTQNSLLELTAST
ncbi:MAG: glycosyltransferase family 4 protein [Aulosira sp. ZfuVER01]|nr:glycosyltransferase family 4 protein [Aulosira sp. ZfuVER01]MDZ8002498.1 glycosyltransferase family 4 protein [Aulosira sp. DedVER01a]MDZ8050824.1 glycosyltransferase family 4 protein [Aulosira sp. ZfuCHP01]